MSVNNGLGDLPRLTQTSVRQAVCSTVSALRNGWSDQEMAEEWGVSAGTVNNATNKKHDLTLLNFLELGRKFGPEGINTVLALLGLKAVRECSVSIDVSQVPLEIATVVPLLIRLLGDGDCKASDVRELEKAGAINTLIEIADFLRQQLNVVRMNA